MSKKHQVQVHRTEQRSTEQNRTQQNRTEATFIILHTVGNVHEAAIAGAHVRAFDNGDGDIRRTLDDERLPKVAGFLPDDANYDARRSLDRHLL